MRKPTLLTIPVSHYCEKARWALERQGVDFAEEAHVPLMSRLAGRRHGAWSTVPVLVTDGTTIPDSTAILRWGDAHGRGAWRAYPEEPALAREVEALEERCDEDLGPHTRRIAYFHLLPNRPLVERLLTDGDVPRLEAAALRLGFPIVRTMIRRGMKVNAEGAARSRVKVEAVFGHVSGLLSDGRRFLVGDRFTAADLSFAALAAPVLSPAEYHVRLPQPSELPPSQAADIEALRATPAGRYAARLYDEERHV